MLGCQRERHLILGSKGRAPKKPVGTHFLYGRVQGENNMGTIPADRSEPIATTQTLASPEKHARPEHSVDKFADARKAKKKQRRARHRARLKRSHTNG
jgi:hypothetical protein